MKVRLIGAALLLMLSISGLAATPLSRVEAAVTLPYDTILPGIPFDITVTVKNVSHSAVAVGTSARLIVSLPDGRKVSPEEWEILEPRVSPNSPTWVELAPGESQQFFVDWHYGMPSMFHHPEFSGPGVYSVSLELAAYQPPENYVGTVFSSAARLTRTVAPGEDEALWKRMLSAEKGKWADDGLADSENGPAILREILQIHPTSQYFPYAVALRSQLRPPLPLTNDDITRALAAADRFQASPAYPHLLLLAAHAADSIARYASRDHDSAALFDYFGRAARYYDDAATKSKVLGVRASATRSGQMVRQEIENAKRRAAGTPDNANQ